MNNLEINPNKEYHLAGDISGSMKNTDNLCGGNTRYKYMLEKFKSFIDAAKDFDKHGAPTIILFGEKVHIYEHMTADKIKSEIETPDFEGFTNLHLAIEESYKLHRADKVELASEGKIHPGTQLMIFTDGEPTNRMAVERILFKIVSEIDREEEFQIDLLIVGTVERELQAWLDDLHDKLEDKKSNPHDFDIIHVNKLESISFLGVVGSNRHEDKK